MPETSNILILDESERMPYQLEKMQQEKDWNVLATPDFSDIEADLRAGRFDVSVVDPMSVNTALSYESLIQTVKRHTRQGLIYVQSGLWPTDIGLERDDYDAILSKPYRAAELVNKIRDLLARKI